MRRRYQEHLSGTAKCKYTRSFKPLEIAQCWKLEEGKSLAMKIEHAIKKLSKREKEKLITHPRSLRLQFPCKVITAKQRKNLQQAG